MSSKPSAAIPNAEAVIFSFLSLLSFSSSPAAPDRVPSSRAATAVAAPTLAALAPASFLLFTCCPFVFSIVQLSSMSTSVPKGTRVNWWSASGGTRMQPSLDRVPKTSAVGQVWIATVPGPPPKLSRVGL
jgi:hypothetical protein